MAKYKSQLEINNGEDGEYLLCKMHQSNHGLSSSIRLHDGIDTANITFYASKLSDFNKILYNVNYIISKLNEFQGALVDARAKFMENLIKNDEDSDDEDN